MVVRAVMTVDSVQPMLVWDPGAPSCQRRVTAHWRAAWESELSREDPAPERRCQACTAVHRAARPELRLAMACTRRLTRLAFMPSWSMPASRASSSSAIWAPSQ